MKKKKHFWQKEIFKKNAEKCIAGQLARQRCNCCLQRWAPDKTKKKKMKKKISSKISSTFCCNGINTSLFEIVFFA
jgi:hypothetical protein